MSKKEEKKCAVEAELVFENLVMTPERRDRMFQLSLRILDMLVEETDTPIEAIGCCQAVVDAISTANGLQYHGMFSMDGTDPQT